MTASKNECFINQISSELSIEEQEKFCTILAILEYHHNTNPQHQHLELIEKLKVEFRNYNIELECLQHSELDSADCKDLKSYYTHRFMDKIRLMLKEFYS